jgi:hypothetical protein
LAEIERAGTLRADELTLRVQRKTAHHVRVRDDLASAYSTAHDDRHRPIARLPAMTEPAP